MRHRIKEHTVFDNFLNEELTIVDLGACQGEFTDAVSDLFKIKKAILVEANLSNFNTLEDKPHIKKYYNAIGVNDGNSIVFNIDPNSPYNASEYFNYFDGVQQEVKTISLETICKENDIDFIDILKIDIEGTEYDILENISEELLSKIDQITVEFHEFVNPELKPKTLKIIDRLTSLGFHYTSQGTCYINCSDYYDVLFYRRPLPENEKINEFLKHENYYANNILVNNPLPIEGQAEPTLSYFYDYGLDFRYSLVIPVYNQENIIIKNLSSALKNTLGNFELIMIFDNCTDGSEKLVIDYLKNINIDNLAKVKIISSSTPLFETTCDNIGFRLAEGKYIVEIQADIEIFTHGYNQMLSKPMELYDDIISVSGRCTHNLYNWADGVGKIGGLVEQPLQLSPEECNKFYIGDTCNRGPWVLDKNKLEDLGYLDEHNFVLGDDDHDLNIRANLFKGWVCGYVPMEFTSLLSDGSTRKPMDEINKQYLEARRNRGDGGIIRKINNKEIEFISKEIKTRNI